MNRASRHPNIAVPGDPRERPDIAAGFTQAGQESVPQRIEHKSADGPLIVLLVLLCQGFEYLPVLFFETRRFDKGSCSSRVGLPDWQDSLGSPPRTPTVLLVLPRRPLLCLRPARNAATRRMKR
jgi:hypothetical protein